MCRVLFGAEDTEIRESQTSRTSLEGRTDKQTDKMMQCKGYLGCVCVCVRETETETARDREIEII